MSYYPSDLFYNVASLSGCAWHYVADDLDVAHNTNLALNPVTWVNRGSTASGVSTLTPSGVGPVVSGPVLKKYAINGHNSVRFLAASGTFKSLISVGGQPRHSQITQLALFKHITAPTGLAMFFGLVDKSQPNKRVNFSTYFTDPSGWNFTALDSFITLDSRTVNNCIYLNDWMIKSDIAKVSYYSMRRNGTEIDQYGAFLPLPTSSNGYFTVGGEDTVAIHDVELAELVVFNRILPTGEIQDVENIWKRIYFIGGGNAMPLFMYSTTNSGYYNSETTLFMGTELPSSGCTLYVGSASVQSSGTTLYMGSALVKSSGTTLYMYGRDLIPPTDHPELGGMPLYLGGGTVASYSSVGSGSVPVPVPLIIWGTVRSGAGAGGQVTQNTRRSVLGVGYPGNLIPPVPDNNISEFELDGSDLKHLGAIYRGIGTGSTGGQVDNFGLYTSRTLYIHGGVSSNPFPLFIQAEPKGDGTGALPLFLKVNESSGVSNLGASLFIQNDTLQQTKSTKLFIKGLGGLVGGLTQPGSMPLYIERWPAGGCTLFVMSTKTPSSTSLYIGSANSLTKTTTLAISGGPQPAASSSISLFVNPGLVFPSSIPMYVKGLPTLTGTSTLYTSGF